MKSIIRFAVLISALTSCASPPKPSSNVEIVAYGADKPSTVPASAEPVADPSTYDVVIVGGGLAGLSAAVYLTDRGHKILLVEKEPKVGGLAAWADGDQISYDRGAAYWTDTYEEEQKILNHIGLKNFKKENAIPEPIDSYYVRGQFFAGIWDEETLLKLPASFAVFHFQLQRADAENLIPNQPFEEFTKYGGKMDLDEISAEQWIEKMPADLERSLPELEKAAKGIVKKGDKSVKTNPRLALSEAKRILARYHAEMDAHKLKGKNGMLGVVELMDLYCRSALGGESREISAMAFANFYISEIETRFTTPKGTGVAAGNMMKILMQKPKLATVLTEAPVYKIVPGADSVETYYTSQGQRHVAKSKYVAFSAQLTLAPKIIDGFTAGAPEQVKLISQLGYSHYSVHVLHVKGHPYRATYDTWMYPDNYSLEAPTDVILGRWVDPKLAGYIGYRDFKKDPPDASGILAIYHPLEKKWLKPGAFTEESAKVIARDATTYVSQILEGLPPSLFRGPLVIQRIETNLWPLSVHIPAPGYYLHNVRVLRHPYKRVIFGNNNLGTPAFEEALFRGHCAAVNILSRLDKNYHREAWSRCPIDVD